MRLSVVVAAIKRPVNGVLWGKIIDKDKYMEGLLKTGTLFTPIFHQLELLHPKMELLLKKKCPPLIKDVDPFLQKLNVMRNPQKKAF
jgi:hypothetical protein